MSDPENLVLPLLRAIRTDIGEIRADMREMRGRISIVEATLVSMQQQLDRTRGDVERIKQRLELVDADR